MIIQLIGVTNYDHTDETVGNTVRVWYCLVHGNNTTHSARFHTEVLQSRLKNYRNILGYYSNNVYNNELRSLDSVYHENYIGILII